MYQLDSLLGRLFSAEGDEGIAPVQATQGVHHEPQVPDRPRLLKERNQLIFKQVTGDLPDKNLQEKETIFTITSG